MVYQTGCAELFDLHAVMDKLTLRGENLLSNRKGPFDVTASGINRVRVVMSIPHLCLSQKIIIYHPAPRYN